MVKMFGGTSTFSEVDFEATELETYHPKVVLFFGKVLRGNKVVTSSAKCFHAP